MLQRQKERERFKQFVVVTRMIRTSKERIKKTSTGLLNVYNKPINPISRAIKAIKESPAIPLRSIGTDSSLLLTLVTSLLRRR